MVNLNTPIDRGDVVWASLNPTQGHEQSGHRPHLVISRREYQDTFGMVIAVPMTHATRNWPTRVQVEPGSYAICEQPRTLSLSRVSKVGPISHPDTAEQAAQIVARLISDPA